MDSAEIPFLRDLLARPDDAEARRRYAEWLDAKGQSRRADYLRLDPALARLDCVRWLDAYTEGDLGEYLESRPDLRPLVDAYRASAPARDRRRAMARGIDPGWGTFVESMGSPFEPFGFFDNTAVPVACAPDVLPFAEPIGTRGPIVTFASDFRDPADWSEGLMQDLGFLATLGLEDCHYGAASCPVHPFVCRLRSRGAKPSKAEVLAALRPSKFDGFAEGDSYRDQIHQDFLEQPIFPHPDEQVFEVVRIDVQEPDEDVDEIPDFSEGGQFSTSFAPEENAWLEGEEDDAEGWTPAPDEEDEDDERNLDVDETTGVHGALRSYVDEDLWYVLLHTRPVAFEPGGPAFPEDVILFAVGRSPHGGRLVGVVSHQKCHNLCD